MDSRQRFVLLYAAVALAPFTVFTFLNTNDIGVFVSSYTIVYFALRLMLNPKMRLKSTSWAWCCSRSSSSSSLSGGIGLGPALKYP
jgi:hypothetical protein